MLNFREWIILALRVFINILYNVNINTLKIHIICYLFPNFQAYVKVCWLVLSQIGFGISNIRVNRHHLMFKTDVLLNQITSLSFLAI